MQREKFIPLAPAIWFNELERLALRCASEPVELEERAVRRAFHLALISPQALRKLLIPAMTDSELEVMLSQGESELAASMLVSAFAEIGLIDASAVGRSIATLTAPGDEVVTFEASSPALAIIGAWAQFLKTARKI